MIKKIGVLTFQNTINYGAVLQTYALMRYLQNVFNQKIEVINYYNDAVTQREKPIQFSSCRGIKSLIKYILNRRAEISKMKAVRLFCEKYIQYSKFDYFESVNPCFEEFKAIIVGSDQIWNLCLTDGDIKYMLYGYNGKGYSYAASIGREGILTPQALGAIKKLRLVSVREISAQAELRKLGVESELVCDPTFLLKNEEWYKLIPESKIGRKYVLLYQMTTSESIFKFAKKIAKEKGAILINANPISLQFFKSRCIRDASPLEWLSLIKNAECVITNSFHGLAFSINFEKEFYTEIRDNEAKNSSRITSLLNVLDLNQRNILSSNFDDRPIDYQKVSMKLDEYRSSSYEYVNKIVKDVNHA